MTFSPLRSLVPRKVLHCGHDPSPDRGHGVGSYLRELIAAQRLSGIDATLLAGSDTPWAEPGLEALDVDGVPVRRFHREDRFFELHSRLYHPAAEACISALLEEERPQLVHVHRWAGLTSNIVEIAARLGIPSVVTLHDPHTSCPCAIRIRTDGRACSQPMAVERCLDCVPRFGHESESELRAGVELFRDQYRAELAMAARVLAADVATAELVSASLGLDPRLIEVLPPPYEPRFRDPYTGAAPRPEPLPEPDAPFRFGYWGELSYLKGIPVLLEAFVRAQERGFPRPAELHLFGAVDTPEVEAELNELAAGAPVLFHGAYDPAELAHGGLHMAVFPTLCFETYGFELDECYELGLPCIVSDLGAVSRRAGDAALRVPPRDAEALAEAMRAVLLHPELRDRLRERIPDVSMGAEEHRRRLNEAYAAALAPGRPKAEPVPPWRRSHLLYLQRESAQALARPAGGPSYPARLA